MQKTEIRKEKAAKLLEMLKEIPPDFRKIRTELENGHYSPEEVSYVGTRFVSNECTLEHLDDVNEDLYCFEMHRFSEPILLPNRHSTCLYEIVELLLSVFLFSMEFGFASLRILAKFRKEHPPLILKL